MGYITTKEASAKWGISTSRITLLANEGRIPGAYRLGKSWLIPANATKPVPRKANHSGSVRMDTDNFSFPLYHFRPDWSYIKGSQLSEQEQKLLSAETAVIECRFHEAYPILEALLKTPNERVTEIGCLWNAGICCIGLNKPEEFSKIYLRLQILLSEDFPHRDDLVIILDILKTYVENLGSSANSTVCDTAVHEQCLPLVCLLNGYTLLSKEFIKSDSADTTLMELNLRFLNSTGAVVAMEMMHCHLLGIYLLRQNMDEAKRHANAIVQIAYENKLYFPLVTYYRYFSPVLASILSKYPEDFQKHCKELISQYNENSTAFFSSINEFSAVSKLTDEDFPYLYAVMNNMSNKLISKKLGISEQTVKRRFARIYEKIGVDTKKELTEFLRNHM